MKKIVITGPESTGKSTLAFELARHYGVGYTKEQARHYLSALGRGYEFEDLLMIASKQVAIEDELEVLEESLLFCDTDLITIKIWSKFKYDRVDSQILDWINQRDYDLYLLCKPDIPWEPDPLRENPEERDLLFEKYLDELMNYQKNFEIIEGLNSARLELAVEIVDKYLKYWKAV